MSLTLPFRPLSPLLVATAAVAVTLGLAAPGMADQVRDNEWWLAEVNIMKAWQTTRGGGVTVAVLDTGVDASQPDLSGSVITGPDYTRSGRRPGTTYWGVHGTAMAALIAGHGHGPGQADGMIGVAPKAKIISVRVSLEELDPLRADAAMTSRLPTAIASGIAYAVRHGAKVIDLPLDPGASYADGTPGAAAAAGGSTAEQNAVSYALRAGVVLVAPAGDDGPGWSQFNYPAAYRGVISVGSFDKTFVKSRFSSRRPYVTLTAPGEGIITAIPGAGYATVRSTSAASAVVAGMAALIRARYPGMTPWQVSRALSQGTRYRPVGGRNHGSGYGTADAMRALNAAAKIEAAAHPVARAASPSPQAGRSTASGRAAVIRDALIGGAAVLLLFSVLIAMQLSRRRKRAPGGPLPNRPLRPPPPPAVRSVGPEMSGPQTVAPWDRSTIEQQRPQLGPVPKLATGRRARPSEGPPWEPAPKPKSEPPWGLIESAPSGSIGGGYVDPAAGMNGRSDAIWHAEPGSLGSAAPRDPSSRPVGTPPSLPAFPDSTGPAAGLPGPGPAAGFPGTAPSPDFPGPAAGPVFPGTARDAELPGPAPAADLPGTAPGDDFAGSSQGDDFARTARDAELPVPAPPADFPGTAPGDDFPGTGFPDPSGRHDASTLYGTDAPFVPREPYGAHGHADSSWPYGHGQDSATGHGTGSHVSAASSAPGRYGMAAPLSALGWQNIAEPQASPQPHAPAGPQGTAGPQDALEPLGIPEPLGVPEPLGNPEPLGAPDPLGAPEPLSAAEQDTGRAVDGEPPRSANAWNPSAKTEDFPAVSGGLHRGGEAGESWPPASPFYPQRFAAPGDPRHARPGDHPASAAADTQAFPVIPLPEIGSYPDDDEDDRHL